MNDFADTKWNDTTIAQTVRHAFAHRLPSFAALLSCCSATLGAVYSAMIVQPMTRLYRHGPSFHGVGFWRGAASADICASLTQLDAQFWREHAARCEQLIRDDVLSYIVFIETMLYFYLLYQTTRFACSLCAAATRRFGQRRGWLARYSPVVAGWMTHAFAKRDVQHHQRRRRRALTPPPAPLLPAVESNTAVERDGARQLQHSPTAARHVTLQCDFSDDDDSPFKVYATPSK